MRWLFRCAEVEVYHKDVIETLFYIYAGCDIQESCDSSPQVKM